MRMIKINTISNINDQTYLNYNHVLRRLVKVMKRTQNITKEINIITKTYLFITYNNRRIHVKMKLFEILIDLH